MMLHGDGGFNVQVFNHKTDYKGAINILTSRARYQQMMS